MKVIPNGIDLNVYRPGQPPIRHLRDDHLNILFVGRLEKRKGLGDLLRAYEFMQARVPKSRLIVVGDGPLRGQIESYIARHRLPNVVMAGFVPAYDATSVARLKAAGGILLVLASALGLWMANSPIDNLYHALLGTKAEIRVGDFVIAKPFQTLDVLRHVAQALAVPPAAAG